MTAIRPVIACLGAGRMGRGIAVAFAYAGHAITMIDVKPRSAEEAFFMWLARREITAAIPPEDALQIHEI